MIEFEGKVKLVLAEKKESIGILLSLEGKQNFTIKVYTWKKKLKRKITVKDSKYILWKNTFKKGEVNEASYLLVQIWTYN